MGWQPGEGHGPGGEPEPRPDPGVPGATPGTPGDRDGRSEALRDDHRHESRAYQPNATLRHLVQVRDHTCTFPSCSRNARESDFEHAPPVPQGREDLCVQCRREKSKMSSY
jgi:hypothetical protein